MWWLMLFWFLISHMLLHSFSEFISIFSNRWLGWWLIFISWSRILVIIKLLFQCYILKLIVLLNIKRLVSIVSISFCCWHIETTSSTISVSYRKSIFIKTAYNVSFFKNIIKWPVFAIRGIKRILALVKSLSSINTTTSVFTA